MNKLKASKHTPLPWFYTDTLDGLATLHTKDGQYIGQVGIAEAPIIITACNAHEELLEALKELYAYATKTIGNHGPIHVWNNALNAITKAEA